MILGHSFIAFNVPVVKGAGEDAMECALRCDETYTVTACRQRSIMVVLQSV